MNTTHQNAIYDLFITSANLLSLVSKAIKLYYLTNPFSAVDVIKSHAYGIRHDGKCALHLLLYRRW